MSDYFIYYLESNAVCLIIFVILLVRDLLSGDRQEKQIKFDHALIAFMLYFILDVFWAAVIAGVVPKTKLTVTIANFSNYVLMTGATYMWLRYVLAYEHVKNRERGINKFAVLFPFLLTTIALAVIYAVDSELLFDSELNLTILFNIFLVTVPIIYIIAILTYTIHMAKAEPNRENKMSHIYVGAFPFMVVVGGLVQTLFLPRTPVYCYSCVILMLILYLQAMEKQISVDPLTGLNNRGQLHRYILQEVNNRKDRRRTFVVMLDVNDFKLINDTYGHAEGDRALILIAAALKKVTKESPIPSFLGRYGGDEFVLILHPINEPELDAVIVGIREEILLKCREEKTPYTISLGAGYDEYLGGQDTIQSCMQRADYKLYLDKQYVKLNAPKKASCPFLNCVFSRRIDFSGGFIVKYR